MKTSNETPILVSWMCGWVISRHGIVISVEAGTQSKSGYRDPPIRSLFQPYNLSLLFSCSSGEDFQPLLITLLECRLVLSMDLIWLYISWHEP